MQIITQKQQKRLIAIHKKVLNYTSTFFRFEKVPYRVQVTKLPLNSNVVENECNQKLGINIK